MSAFEQYIKDVKCTEPTQRAYSNAFAAAFQLTPTPERLVHAALGISTEAGEIVDVIKRTMFYGRTLNRADVGEEIGDLLWYLAVLCDEAGLSFEDCMNANTQKLQRRYPERFEGQRAERDALDEVLL